MARATIAATALRAEAGAERAWIAKYQRLGG